MDMVLALSQRALVGKFDFIKLSWKEIVTWIWDTWKLIIKDISPVMALDGSWNYIFHFLLEEDRCTIEKRLWVIGHGSLIMKR